MRERSCANASDDDSIHKQSPELEAEFLHTSKLTLADMRRLAHDPKDRRLATKPAAQATKEDVLTVQPMSFVEHTACCLFLAFGVPNGALTIPIATWLIGKFVLRNVFLAFLLAGCILLPLAILPQEYVPARLQSWLALQILKYFSFFLVMEERPPTMCTGKQLIEQPARPRIVTAYPHGVFPYGNALTVVTWPLLTGHHIVGLAANAALRTPIFKQILRSIGVKDASRASVRNALETWPFTVGISPGGVAEVFETNHFNEHILLKERIGVIKMAIRTGADLVPGYMYGNTNLYWCWTGEGIPGARWLLEYVSRKILGFALVPIAGRWGLPIPYRTPILCVVGKPIPTIHLQTEEPSMEQIVDIQEQLSTELKSMFDRYKHLYGWEDRMLVIT